MASLGMIVIRKLTFVSTPDRRCHVADLCQVFLSREHFFLLGCGVEIELLENPMRSVSSAFLPIFHLFFNQTSEKFWTMQNLKVLDL